MNMEYNFIKNDDEYCASEEMFRSFVSSNKRIHFEEKGKEKKEIICFAQHEFGYALEYKKVEKSKEVVFHFMIEGSGSNEKQVHALEEFDTVLKEVNEKCGSQFIINTIWNDISSYYSEQLYPQIEKIENSLRKIIYLFMLKTIGSKWFNDGTPLEFKEKVNSVIEKNNKKESDINAEWLMYADFIVLAKFFTAPYSLKTDIKSLFKELDKCKDEENGNVKGKTSNKLTTDLINKLSDEYEPKNNWDRYFSDKLKIKSTNKFSNDWSALYDIRNKVAHGKTITKKDYDSANELINKFSQMFDECIKIIDNLEITIEEADAVEGVAQQVLPQKRVERLVSNYISAERVQIQPTYTDFYLQSSRIAERSIGESNKPYRIVDESDLLNNRNVFTNIDSDWNRQLNTHLRQPISLQETVTAVLDAPVIIRPQVIEKPVIKGVNDKTKEKMDAENI